MRFELPSAMLAAALVLLAGGPSARAQTPTARPVGRIASVEGDVRYNGAPAKIAQSVFEGGVIETGSGTATVLVGGESVIHIDSGSRFRFGQYEGGKQGVSADSEIAVMELTYGRTRALVHKSEVRRKQYQFRSRAAVMGVRGTQIYIDSPKDFSKPQTFATIEGLADLYLPQMQIKSTADLPAVQTASIDDAQKFHKIALAQSEELSHDSAKPESAPRPVRLPEGELQKLASSIVKPPRYVRTEEEIGEEERARRRREQGDRRNRQVIEGLVGRQVFDPVVDGGVLTPVTVHAGSVNIAVP